MLRTALAVSAAKLSAFGIRTLKAGSATSLPGKIGLKLNPNLLQILGRQIQKYTIAITGTNGKSTTAGLLSSFIEASGQSLAHNQLGANMVPGITAALIQKSSPFGILKADFGVIEVDEASLPVAAKALRPQYTVVTNLFRDQLDRYGELNTTAKLIEQGILNSGGQLILNADDPMVASIGTHFPAEMVTYFGVQSIQYPGEPVLDFPVGFPKEVTDCPLCQAPLHYSQTFYGHLGHYTCTTCDFKRPEPWLQADNIIIQAEKSEVLLNCHALSLSKTVNLNLPGLFNAYNLLGSVTAALKSGISPQAVETGLYNYHSLFGRAEKREINGKNTVMMLIKNPIGATEVLKAVTTDPQSRLLIVINDNYADGRDISWLWDAPFEVLATGQKPIWVSGSRASDMAVRLRYAGVPPQLIQQDEDILQGFQKALQETLASETLYVLPTYTALLDISHHLGSR